MAGPQDADTDHTEVSMRNSKEGFIGNKKSKPVSEMKLRVEEQKADEEPNSRPGDRTRSWSD